MSRDPIKPLPPHHPTIAGRTVEITDEDENIIVAFVPVDRKTPVRR
jgi:hypothetical protein